MNTVARLRNLLEQELEAIKYDRPPANLYDPIRYILALGGKRLRPVLTLMGCELYGASAHQAVKAALGIEIFHNFTLVHDDIMDHAPLRRGQPTVHEKWDSSTAILSGDIMLIHAYQHMMQVDDTIRLRILENFNRTAIEVCEGQQIDLNFESMDNVSVEQYIHMITLKTSVLLGCALYTGALIGGATDEQANNLYEFGKNVGIAFQLQDDILDVFGDQALVGKQVGGDILANKKTYLLIKAQALAEGDTATTLQQWLLEANPDPEHKVQAVKAIYEELGVRALAEQEMQEYFGKALEALTQVGGEASGKAALQFLAESLMVRKM